MHTQVRATVSTAIALVVLGVVPVCIGAQQGTVPKLAYINSQAILASAPGRADAELQFNKELEGVQAKEKLWGDSLNVLIGDYGKQEASLSASTKEVRQKAIRDKQADYQQRDQQLRQQLQQRQNDLIQPIMDQINKVINDIRTEDGYAIIFDAQTQGGVIVAADKNLDITDRVIARLKSMPPPQVAKGAGSVSTPSSKPTSGPVSVPAGVSRPQTP